MLRLPMQRARRIRNGWERCTHRQRGNRSRGDDGAEVGQTALGLGVQALQQETTLLRIPRFLRCHSLHQQQEALRRDVNRKVLRVRQSRQSVL